jgi:hypothetical protein
MVSTVGRTLAHGGDLSIGAYDYDISATVGGQELSPDRSS